MTREWVSAPTSLAAIEAALDDPDRARREAAWRAVTDCHTAALHALATADDPLIWNRSAPQELAATAIELLAGTHLHGCFDESASRAARREQLAQIVLFLPHMAAVDAFQHWLYSDPDGAAWPGARDVVWHDPHARSFPTIDWHGLGPARAALWQRRPTCSSPASAMPLARRVDLLMFCRVSLGHPGERRARCSR